MRAYCACIPLRAPTCNHSQVQADASTDPHFMDWNDPLSGHHMSLANKTKMIEEVIAKVCRHGRHDSGGV